MWLVAHVFKEVSQKLRHRDYLCILWSVYSLLKVITLIWKGTCLDNILKSIKLHLQSVWVHRSDTPQPC